MGGQFSPTSEGQGGVCVGGVNLDGEKAEISLTGSGSPGLARGTELASVGV